MKKAIFNPLDIDSKEEVDASLQNAPISSLLKIIAIA